MDRHNPTKMVFFFLDANHVDRGTSSHTVKVFNFQGNELSRFEPYSSFLQQNRGSPISATAFHPHQPILGCAARGDHHVNLFTCEKSEPLQLG
jgi:regulator-associated protein of mTOR